MTCYTPLQNNTMNKSITIVTFRIQIALGLIVTLLLTSCGNSINLQTFKADSSKTQETRRFSILRLLLRQNIETLKKVISMLHL
jgi:hypothetical protein